MPKTSTQAKGSRKQAPPRERTVQSSVSLPPSQWARLDVLGDLTRWGRSGAVAEAVDLLTALPVSVTQRLATLKRTTAAATLEARLRSAVEDAVAAAEQELGDDPQAEFAAALVTVGTSLQGTADAKMSDDLRAAEAYGVDLSLLRASLRETPLARVRSNDAALAFFSGVSLTRGDGSPVGAEIASRPRRRGAQRK